MRTCKSISFIPCNPVAGVLAVKRVNGVPTAFPADTHEVSEHDNMLQVVYDNGPVQNMRWEDFDAVRARAQAEWHALPRTADSLSASLQDKVQAQLKQRSRATQVAYSSNAAGAS